MTEYDIPDVERVERMMHTWTAIQVQAYIRDLYIGLMVRDKEVESLRSLIGAAGAKKESNSP